MTYNSIKIISLISAISAGSVAYADAGYSTGHHTLVPSTQGESAGIKSKPYVSHNGQFADWPVSAEGADIHHENVQRNDMAMKHTMGSNWPLPQDAGSNR